MADDGSDFDSGDDSSYDYSNSALSGGPSTVSLPALSAPADSGSSGGSSVEQSGQTDGSSSQGLLASLLGGGTASLGDNTSSPTGSGALALTNGGGGGGTAGTDPYSGGLNQSGGITNAVNGTPTKSLLQTLAGTVTDGNGNLDLEKLIKIGTGLGGAFAAYEKNKKASSASNGSPAAAAANPQVTQGWTPAQALSAASYFNTPQNRTPLVTGAQGVQSIIPASTTRPQVGYADGGSVSDSSVGASGDSGNGSTTSPPSTAVPPNPIIAAMIQNILTGKTGAQAPAPDQTASMKDSGKGLLPLINVMFDDDAQKSPDTSGLVPSMADGGGVVGQNPDMGALAQTAPQGQGQMSHGTYGLISGPGDGQSDSIPINAAAGEYMVDAESVSMLGNGDNNAGAQALDAWREQLRQMKRAAPPNQIAPQTGPAQMPPTGAQ